MERRLSILTMVPSPGNPHPHLDEMKAIVADKSLQNRSDIVAKLKPFVGKASREECHLLFQHTLVKHLEPLEMQVFQRCARFRELTRILGRVPDNDAELRAWEERMFTELPTWANFISLDAKANEVPPEFLLDRVTCTLVRVARVRERLEVYSKLVTEADAEVARRVRVASAAMQRQNLATPQSVRREGPMALPNVGMATPAMYVPAKVQGTQEMPATNPSALPYGLQYGVPNMPGSGR